MGNTAELKARKLRWWGVVIGILYLVLQHSIYLLGHNLAGIVNITPFLPKIDVIDNAIPIISIFILPYIWSYAFWAMGPMAVAKCESKHYKNFIVACIVSMLAGMIVLIFAPTYMNRVTEGLYVVRDNSIFEKLRFFWYSLDGSEMAYNLFPSFHCLNSTMCFLGVMGRKEIPKWFRVYSFIMMILIFASTVCVKQHYVLDVISGIALAVIAYVVVNKWNWGRVFDPIERWYTKRKSRA